MTTSDEQRGFRRRRAHTPTGSPAPVPATPDDYTVLLVDRLVALEARVAVLEAAASGSELSEKPAGPGAADEPGSAEELADELVELGEESDGDDVTEPGQLDGDEVAALDDEAAQVVADAADEADDDLEYDLPAAEDRTELEDVLADQVDGDVAEPGTEHRGEPDTEHGTDDASLAEDAPAFLSALQRLRARG